MVLEGLIRGAIAQEVLFFQHELCIVDFEYLQYILYIDSGLFLPGLVD